MSSRRRVLLGREGWYYLIVLTFIIGGAVLREVNLLLVLAAVMLSPLVFNWRLAMAALVQLRVRHRMPDRIHAGEPLTVELRVANERFRLPAWALVLRDRFASVEPVGRVQLEGTAEVLIPHIPAADQRGVAYRVTIPRRGRYRFGPVRVSTRIPFGFVEAYMSLPSSAELLVAPPLGHLTRQARQMLAGNRSGQKTSRHRRGLLEADYYGLREWQPGDSRRWIHWRSSAKVGGLAVLQFEDQVNDDLTLLLDLWQPAQPSDEDRQRVDLAVSVMATFVLEELGRARRNLKLIVLGADSAHWSGGNSRRMRDEIFDCLAVIDGSPQPDWKLAAAETSGGLGGSIFVISTRSSDQAPREVQQSAGGGRWCDRGAGPMWLDVGSPSLAEYFVKPEIMVST